MGWSISSNLSISNDMEHVMTSIDTSVHSKTSIENQSVG